MRKRVFLSASIPVGWNGTSLDLEELRKRKDAWDDYYRGYGADADEILRAVTEIARSTLGHESITLTYGGHPSITPVITNIAARAAREKATYALELYQSAFFAGRERLERSDEKLYSLLRWTPICHPAEKGGTPWTRVFEPGEYPLNDPEHVKVAEEVARLQHSDTKAWDAVLKASLTYMRGEMIRDCCGGVFVGGMIGIEEELAIFEKLNPGRPRWLIEYPGGRTKRLAEQAPEADGKTIVHGNFYEAEAVEILSTLERMSA